MVVVDKNILNISSKILFSTRVLLHRKPSGHFPVKIDKIRHMISPEGGGGGGGAKGRWIRHWIILFKLISIYGPDQYNEILLFRKSISQNFLRDAIVIIKKLLIYSFSSLNYNQRHKNKLPIIPLLVFIGRLCISFADVNWLSPIVGPGC